MLPTINWKKAETETPVGDECYKEILVSVVRPEGALPAHVTTAYWVEDIHNKGKWVFFKDGYYYPKGAINFWAKMPDPHHDK